MRLDELQRTLGAQLVETHISWVLLGAERAWKIKKTVRFGPVDYTTAEARRRFCDEEVRVNRRLAPELYLGVVMLGDPPEPAVEMRRFPAGALFSERLEAGTLTGEDVDALAERLARFHGAAPSAPPAGAFGNPAGRAQAALDVAPPELRDWIERESERLMPLWAARRERGFVREGHGDLHLANLLAFEGRVLAFDAIEFDEALRWIDIVDDLAFAVMDFAAQGRRDFAFRLLNGWLDRTGDHGGVAVLRFALVYRALVRARVAAARQDAEGARRYLEAATSWTRNAPPALTITHGLPGSGKTFESQRRLEREGALRLRSDVERKRLFGLAMHEDSHERGLDIYAGDATSRTYAKLFGTAAQWLREGWPVILDAAFLKRAERDAAREIARAAGVPLRILHCDAPDGVLRERLLARRADASEADVRVLQSLTLSAEPLGADETADLVRSTSAA